MTEPPMSDSTSTTATEQPTDELQPTHDPAEIARREAENTEALAHLAKMSGTGSSFGGTDYVAINTIAVASLILGFAAAMSLVVSLFLIVPVVGIGLAIWSIYQIRHSNGTQGGYLFAVGGVVLCLLFGGISGVRELSDWLTAREEMRLAAETASKFGKEIAAGNYGVAYDQWTDGTFRARVPFKDFQLRFESADHKKIESIEWDRQPMLLEHLPNDEIRATFLTNITFAGQPTPAQLYFRVLCRDGKWKVSSLPTLFDEKARPPRK